MEERQFSRDKFNFSMKGTKSIRNIVYIQLKDEEKISFIGLEVPSNVEFIDVDQVIETPGSLDFIFD